MPWAVARMECNVTPSCSERLRLAVVEVTDAGEPLRNSDDPTPDKWECAVCGGMTAEIAEFMDPD